MFTHLHCHTEYSLLDGAIKLKELCARAKELDFPAVCITDHGNMFGALTLYTMAKDFGLKPIIGCEIYLTPGELSEKITQRFHLVLLAQNKIGYHNLIKIVTIGCLQGFYYKPRVNKKILAQYSEGLIALSACLKGEIQDVFLEHGPDQAIQVLEEYQNIFGDRFYLEVQANDLKEQVKVNEFLYELSKDRNVPLVCTNDCHYLNQEDYEAHDILLCIQTNAKVNDSKRMRFNTKELYFKSLPEMQDYFSFCPEAFDNVSKIIEQCNLELELGVPYFPHYELPQNVTLEQEFERLAKEGLKKRLQKLDYVQDEAIYWERLQTELEVIEQKGFPGYFLIVQDFINWAKKNNIPVGPGRGSAAGSLVAYALGITNLDPLRYNLLFERFLNVERMSLPDIDVDFCYEKRDKVIEYVTQKYGKQNVAQITTFGTMKAKAAVRDVGRALDLSLSLVDKIAKLIPDELKMTIDKALEQEPKLGELANTDANIQKLLNVAKRLEGLARHASTHAAGVVISDKPMWEYLPLYLGKKGEVVTQYDMKRVEQAGLIKFDFLGLKTLTVIQNTLKLAKYNQKTVPDLETLPLDDPKTFELLSRGDTQGVFQLESEGMRNVLKDLQPSCFEDVIALLALYRPGPIQSGMVSDFIERKHGRKKVEYPHPDLEPILKDTYGVILYQEQVMQIASVLANYSLGDGDILRRAMGKKNPEVMAKQRSKFMEGAKAKGVDEKTAAYIFDLMEKFAGYGFNKSHSAAYALISYQTAYLKAHFPVEFMAALITSEIGNSSKVDKVVQHLNAARKAGIKILPPDVNKSFFSFSVEQEQIRFGLGAIKDVGQAAIESIVRQREKNGPFTSLFDFCSRVNLRKVTKRVIERLIWSGAMDCFGVSRKTLLTHMEEVIQKAQASKKQTSNKSLFKVQNLQKQKKTGLGLDLPEEPEFEEKEKLRLEKQALGMYLSGHPLQPYSYALKKMGINSIQDCQGLAAGTKVKLAGLCLQKKKHTGKNNKKMAFCQVEDFTGQCELTIFSELLSLCEHLLEQDEPLYIEAKISDYTGKVTSEDEEDQDKPLKLTAEKIMLLAEAMQTRSEPIILDISLDFPTENLLKLKDILNKYKGNAEVRTRILGEKGSCILCLSPEWRVEPCPEFWDEYKQLLN